VDDADRDRRLEDPPLLRGEARFAADHRPPGLAHLAVIRSPLPHGLLGRIDLEGARRSPGVLAVWTAEDLPPGAELAAPAPPGVEARPRPILARGRVRYVGEPLAVVVAEDRGAAADAAQRVEVELDPLPGVGGVEAALAPAAVPIHEGMASNLAGSVRRAFGDVERAFAGARRVAASFRLARVSGGYLEPRAVTVEPAPEGGLVVRTSTQWVFGVRDAIAGALGLERSRVRVLASSVGGAFGAKGMPYPEEVLAALAALRLGRPVQWVASRSEDTPSTAQSHGTVLHLELAADSDGRLRGLRGRVLHDLGAYAASGSMQVDNIGSHLSGAYRLPALDVRFDLVYTNEVPTGFIRGGGREVGIFALERLMDRLAGELGLDRFELRRRNLVRPEEMPYPTGYAGTRGPTVLDGGDYPALLDRARELAGRPGADEGIGVACFVEATGIGLPERARLRVEGDGGVTVWIGTTPQGQGHRTVAARLAAERLGWPVDHIRVVSGDSTAVDFSFNTSASRSAVEMGNAVARAARAARRRLRELAAERLEADPADVALGPAGAEVRGVPARRVALAELVGDGLEVTEAHDPRGRRAYAAGCAVAVVRVDPETGAVRPVRYVMLHDVGRPLHRGIVEGQAQGGFAHGLGYALLEEAAYAADGGFLAPTFLDYLIPSAAEVPEPVIAHLDTPASSNPEGVRGAGEGGTIPVAAAVLGAVEDALRARGFETFWDRLPLTPEAVAMACRGS